MKSIAALVAMVPIAFLIFGESQVTALNVTTSAELQGALNKATAGDIIILLPQEYVGNFNISSSGSEGKYIYILGTSIFANGEQRYTIISNNGSGVIFDVVADFVKIGNMRITNAEIGIKIKGNNNVATSLTIDQVQHGVVIHGDQNHVRSSTIESLDTGVQITGNQNSLSGSTIHKGNKGVVINGTGTTVGSCTIKETADTGLTVEKGNDTKIGTCTLSSIKISPESSGGTLSSTTLKGRLDLQGHGYTIESVSSGDDVNIQGCDNIIQSTFFTGSNVSVSSCN